MSSSTGPRGFVGVLTAEYLVAAEAENQRAIAHTANAVARAELERRLDALR